MASQSMMVSGEPKHEERAHSKIGASSMHRWAHCPGSVALCENIPNKESVFAKEGTEAHEIAEILLRRELFGKPLGHKSKERLRLASEEMLDAVSRYVNYACELLAQVKKSERSFLHVEHRFNLSRHLPVEGLFGTADLVAYDAENLTLHVVDYKHGMGVRVNPEENDQLLYYALGAALDFPVPLEKVVLSIVQPRVFGAEEACIKSWECDASYLFSFEERLLDAARATQEKNAPLNPGEHCRFCPAQPTCPALHKAALAVASGEFGVVGPDGELSQSLLNSEEALLKALELAPKLQAWISAVNAHAYQLAVQGKPPKGYKLVQKRPKRAWLDEAQAIEALTDSGVPKDQMFEEPSLKSPAQIEKLGRELKNVVASLTYSVSSGTVLVPETDKRPAVTDAIPVEFEALEPGESGIFD